MKTDDEIKEIAYRLLTPNDTLDVSIFDFQNKMHPEVREILLNNAQYIINNTINKIKGLVIHDIYLNGSAAGYFYYDRSDIDMRIEIHNNSCEYVTKDEYLFNRFLHALFMGSFPGFRFELNKRLLDIKLSCKKFEIVGLYSILRDEWEVKPDKHFADNLNVDDIMQKYQNRYAHIKNHLNLYLDKTSLDEKDQQELGLFYSNLIRGNNVSAQDYIIYKLLNYSGIFQEIKKILNDGVKAYLTIG